MHLTLRLRGQGLVLGLVLLWATVCVGLHVAMTAHVSSFKVIKYGLGDALFKQFGTVIFCLSFAICAAVYKI